ncbi:hypothetical protein H257_10701 [Aphanomyces astaci]|uniref:DDE Tnp4 domain-containing protein n=1 Tax=Aphanomyces astaci TaxID=112090 RepID=W4G4E2_APHAT|nr:hypothetical protein H257_10701 [Aphanomyces astaci]ETV74552.1 hypothetical protein H257_10701 [Aphanomyces astaci]|eukprot:XP_009835639.1 hypothetical protein H257_10701 [Aphanomyces astaci]
MSRRLQEILADPAKTDVGMKVASDSAFPVSGRCTGRIVTPLKKGDLERQLPACRLGLKVMCDCITSLRQAAEWGMGAVSKVYRQLLMPLAYNPSLRAMRHEKLGHQHHVQLVAADLADALLGTPFHFSYVTLFFSLSGTRFHDHHHRHEI